MLHRVTTSVSVIGSYFRVTPLFIKSLRQYSLSLQFNFTITKALSLVTLQSSLSPFVTSIPSLINQGNLIRSRKSGVHYNLSNLITNNTPHTQSYLTVSQQCSNNITLSIPLLFYINNNRVHQNLSTLCSDPILLRSPIGGSNSYVSLRLTLGEPSQVLYICIIIYKVTHLKLFLLFSLSNIISFMSCNPLKSSVT